ncbi:discoidin domain-containing protein [Actinoplanes sp. DH11]|uniref:discoidin domain-containing protein n=1 Tax=Actinoplanes sp. DH11 TaxID=2857011 RepID=UPI001E438663|nr:discoidin domain-containing protein [Actinoplanes sp. DH11]
MRLLRTSLLTLPLLATAVLAAAPPAAAANTSYYVDCSATAAGSGTEASPWNSFAPVNSRTFTSGDRVLIRRGTTCVGQQLWPKGSGAAGAANIIDAYGTGAKPVLAGNGAVDDVVKLYNQQHWEIRNLDISNKGAAPAARRGVHIIRENSGTGTYYRITGVDVHDVNGVQNKKDDNASAGIFFEVLGNTTPTKFDDVVISGSTVRAVDRYGIHFWTRWMTRPELANPNCGATCGTWTPQTRVVVRGNTVTDIGGDAIVVHHTQSALVENNRVDGFRMRDTNCAAGIWGWNINDALFQFNEVSGGRSTCDGQGFDLDEGNIRTIYQYNYSHDNEGGFILLCNGGGSTTRDNIVRYNISQNDRGQIFDLICGKITNTKIYNNVFYVGQAAQIINNSNGSTGANAEFYNNIFYVDNGQSSYNAGGLLFHANTFYGQHPAGEPFDPAKSTADPLLVAPGTATSIGNAGGYRLRAGSPALASGQAMPGPGSRDYFGGPVTTGCRPDRGAHQLSTTCTAGPTLISRDRWSLKYADSQETTGENGAAVNAFDGNTATIWHTGYSGGNAPMPHEIQINMGTSQSVSGLRYLPRQDSGAGAANGRIGQYEIYVSADGVTWGAAVATGTFAGTAAQKEVRFTAKTGQYLRLRALSEVGGNPWTTAAEIHALS